jgi:hypothetical protein
MYLNSVNISNAKNMDILLETLPKNEQSNGKTVMQQLIEMGEAKANLKFESVISSIIINQPHLTDAQISNLYGIELVLVQRLRQKMVMSS